MDVTKPEESIVPPENITPVDIKPEENIVPSQVVTSEEILLPMEQEKPIEIKTVEPEQSIIFPQISSITTTAVAGVESKVSTITTEVSLFEI